MLEVQVEEQFEKNNNQETQISKKDQVEVDKLKVLIKERNVKIRSSNNNEFLLRVMNYAKYDSEKALYTVEQYNKIVERHPRLSDPELIGKLRFVFELQVLFSVPYRDKHGRFIYMQKIGDFEPGKCEIEDLFCAGWTCLEKGYSSVEAQRNGMISIIDMKGVQMKHYKLLDLEFLKTMITILQGGYPVEMVEIHIVNTNFLFNLCYQMIKHLMSKELQAKFHLHGSKYDDLHSAIGIENLPEDYGGKRAKLDSMDFYNMITNHTT